MTVVQNATEWVRRPIAETIGVLQAVLADTRLLRTVEGIVAEMVRAFQADAKVLFAGNGGSAADAQHLAAELSGRFYYDREPLFAEALHVNSSYLTAVANDYAYEEVYERLLKAKGRSGDVFVAISTSGRSKNIVKAADYARAHGMVVVAMTGEGGGHLKEHAQYLIDIPSRDTPRIQECHITVGHVICAQVEQAMFPRE